MDYVFILENEHHQRYQLQKALRDINPLLGTKLFANVEEFYNWLKEIMAQGARSWTEDEDDKNDTSRVRLLITRAEFFGPNRMDLLERIKDLFIRKNLCTAEQPVQFLLTAFDDPTFRIEGYEHPIVANVIFMPFDELILREHINYALAGRVPPSEFGLTYQRADTTIEMLKNVRVEKMTDIGFTSRSRREFTPGLVSKYYGQTFNSERLNWVYARLVRCGPHPKAPEEFELEFHYFGLDPTQISSIRKAVRVKDSGGFVEKPFPAPKNPVSHPAFVIIEPRDNEFESIAGTLRRKVRGCEISRFLNMKAFEDELNMPAKCKSNIFNYATIKDVEISRDFFVRECDPSDATLWGEPLKDSNLSKFFQPQDLKALGLWLLGAETEVTVITNYNGQSGVIDVSREKGKIIISETGVAERLELLRGKRRFKSSIAALFANARDIDPKNLSSWESLKRLMSLELTSAPPTFLISEQPLTEDLLKHYAEGFEDVFINPVDRGYFLQKLVRRVPGLKLIDQSFSIVEKTLNAKIKAANPIEIEEISEAAMTMRYRRELSIGTFREFVLWQPFILGVPQILGTCYACEAVEGKNGEFVIYMVLFGMRDHLLKSIRLWIRENYVQSKERASG
ncbi:MAG: hypothetical protein C5B49_16640 [Bdellovibrio sp.]|nr:MAG: hypothetical protein C5B49_16640 [Bdellovibrio sp.]